MSRRGLCVACPVSNGLRPPPTPAPSRAERYPPNYKTIDTELWSTYDLRLDVLLPEHPMQWFQYGQAQQVSGGHGRVATQADTNLVRTGSSGLQQDCKMEIRAWRARAIAPRALLRSDEWWEWCATVRVDFIINMRMVAAWTFDELLRAPRPRVDGDSPGSFRTPITLPAGLAFEVRMTPTVLAKRHDHARQIAIATRPEYALLPPSAWTPIKLRCYLRGDLTRPDV